MIDTVADISWFSNLLLIDIFFYQPAVKRTYLKPVTTFTAMLVTSILLESNDLWSMKTLNTSVVLD